MRRIVETDGELVLLAETVEGAFSEREALLAALTPPEAHGPRFRATFTEGRTVDGREIAPGAVRFDRDPPLPLMFTPATTRGHLGATLVGAVTSLRRSGSTIVIEGRFDSPTENPDAAAAVRLVREGLLTTWSPDIGDADLAFVGDADEARVRLEGGVLLAATIVPIPALDGTSIEILDDDEALVAAATGDLSLPVAGRDRPWDGAAAARRVFESCTRDGALDDRCASRAFFWRDSAAGPGRRTAYKLGFADVVDGRLTMIPRGVFAAAAVVSGARGGVDIPAEEAAAVRRRISRAYARLREALDDPSLRAPWERPEEASAESREGAAAVTWEAAAGGFSPPREAFEVPEPDHLQPVVVRDGRVTGHLASWRTCHTGVRGVCQLAPRSASGYRAFHTGSVVCADGSVLAVGRLTAATSHAPLDAGPDAARRHYEDSGTVWALVRASDGRHGIWVSGVVLPDVPEEVLVRAASCPLSGDWRMIDGHLELVAALSVPVPGFPLVASASDCSSLVASGPTAGDVLDDLARRLAALEAEVALLRPLGAAQLARELEAI